MAKPVGGRISIKIDGQILSVRGNVTSNIGQLSTRTSVKGMDRPHGFTEEPTVPFLQCDVTERIEFPLSLINAVTDSTVTGELADGRTLVLRNAWHVGDAERNSDTGASTIRFEGMSGEEMGA